MARGGTREFEKIIHHYEPWIDNKRHRVAVKMKVSYKHSSSDTVVEFYTEHFKDENDRPRKEKFSTLPELYDWIEVTLATLPDVTWKDKIYIEVRGRAEGDLEGHKNHNGESLMSASVEIYATALQIGTATDGTIYSRAVDQPKHVTKFDKKIGYGLEKEKRYSWQTDKEYKAEEGKPYSRALIDDTEENRKLLVQFAVKFDQLRDQFFRAFGPDYVRQFLAKTSGLVLLDTKPKKAKSR